MSRHLRSDAAETGATAGKRGVDVYRSEDSRSLRGLSGVSRQARQAGGNGFFIGAFAEDGFEGDSAWSAFADGRKFSQDRFQARNLGLQHAFAPSVG